MEQEDLASLAKGTLLKIREKLLDLTPRNRLLNFKESKRTIRIVDELPNHTFDALVSDGRHMELLPKPVKVPYEDFVVRAIQSLREEGSIGIYCSRSGFRDAFVKYYEGQDPEPYLERMENEGRIRRQKTGDDIFISINEEYKASQDDEPPPESDDYELPLLPVEEKHRDYRLQTPFSPKVLEKRCKALKQEARTAIEETGSNFLHLAMGFLEWYDSDDSDILYKAPLILVPIQIERYKIDRKNNCFNYQISYSGEDLETNLSLRQKLSADFDILLPELDPERTDPEEYFAEVSRLVRHMPRWRVAREMIVGMFSFGKILMYKDLSPDNWPTLTDVRASSKLREVLVGSESGELHERPYGEEYDIDERKEDIPLILDADSSQHSAIIDVLGGSDLVVEGPPGTGKSQTISNIIAAALQRGKSVLFVAEKKAALEVVRRRLDQVDLGAFCLELHSYKTQKGKLHADLKKRLELQLQDVSNLQYEIEDLVAEKKRLSAYASLMNKESELTGLTIFEILWAAERWQSEGPDNRVTFSITDAYNLSRQEINERLDVINEIARVYSELPPGARAAWNGFRPKSILPGDEESVLKELESLKAECSALNSRISRIAETHKFAHEVSLHSLLRLASVNIRSLNIPECFNQDIASRLPGVSSDNATNFTSSINNNYKLVYELKDNITNYRSLIDKSAKALANPDISLGQCEEFSAALKDIISCGFRDEHAERLPELEETASRTLQCIENVKNLMASFISLFGFETLTIRDIHKALLFTKTVINAPDSLPVHYFTNHISPSAPGIFQRAKEELSLLKHDLYKYSSTFELDKLPSHRVLRSIAEEIDKHSGGILSVFSLRLRKARKKVQPFLSQKGSTKPSFIVEKLHSVADLLEKIDNAKNSKEYSDTLGPLFRGISTDWGRLEKLIGYVQSMREVLGSQNLSKSVIENIRHYKKLSEDMSSRLEREVNDLDKNLSILKRNLDLDIRVDDLVKLTKDIGIRLLRFSELSRQSAGMFREGARVSDILGSLEAKLSADGIRDAVNKDVRFKKLLGDKFKGIDTPIDDCCNIAEWIKSTHDRKDLPSEIGRWLISEDSENRLSALKDICLEARGFINSFSTHISALTNIGPLDFNVFFLDDDSSVSIDKVVDKTEACIYQIASLALWSDYCRLCEKGDAFSLRTVFEAIERGSIEPGGANPCYRASLYRSIAREIFRKYPELADFTRAGHEEKRKRFIELDKAIIKKRSAQIAENITRERKVPIGVGYGRISNYSEVSLINKEISKKKRHIPIRQLVRRASGALQALKPCFMMSPLSVAQYLIPGNISFDIVVMDEASQIRPQDALGAIARSEQLVIVGDQNQLPPTSFFQRTGDESLYDEEAASIQENESILDEARIRFRKRRLCWHYRSEHESLIAFSNREFYDDELIVFPSPYVLDGQKLLGVHSHYVRGTTYLKGRNIGEAEEVINGIIHFLKHFPECSVGVATFNQEQRDLIEDLLDKKQKQDPWVDEAIMKALNSDEPFFIKNLENVQGDERDIIIISTTYGPDPDTQRVYQRFGPVGGEFGWRRLNVIFTRAKKRVQLYTSMRPHDIQISDHTKRGVVTFKRYLEYAEKGQIYDSGTVTGREPESDFEVSVAKVLNSHGFETVPQVGVAGFYIDMAVLHPNRKGEYLLGIECDGANYHSAKSARDRDRLRQEVLEKKGWKLHRIWSTDWFKNREKEIGRLLSAIRKLIESERAETRLEGIIKEDIELPREPISSGISEEDLSRDMDEELRNRLLQFRKMRIDTEFPGENGILRDEILNHLVRHKIINRKDFQSKIPTNLRMSISSKQAKFLDEIFEIIEEYA